LEFDRGRINLIDGRDSVDEKLASNITDGETYNNFRDWAETIGPQTVKDAPNAWVSFALGQDTLLETPPTDEDLEIEAFGRRRRTASSTSRPV